ncbi:MAG: cell wall-binding repeat-containing protein [Anaerosomatales bacterium]|nr:cell wall-binding repeat-containing protein [Anaerosomatales bacterium]
MRTARRGVGARRLLTLMTILAVVIALVPVVPAGAVIIPQSSLVYVDASVTGPGTGTAADPFRLFTDAVAAVAPGGTIMVAPGYYDPALGETPPYMIPTGVTIEGTEDDSGDLPVLFGTADASAPVLVFDGVEGNVVRNIVVAENFNSIPAVGEVTAEVEGIPGGGAYVGDSSVLFEDCIFVFLSAPVGGAVYAEWSDLTMRRSYVVANGNPFLWDVAVEAAGEVVSQVDPSADIAAAFVPEWCMAGGGVAAFAGTATFEGCWFEANSAAYLGGGIATEMGTIDARDSVFIQNAADDLSAVDDLAAERPEVRAAQPAGSVGGCIGAVNAIVDVRDSVFGMSWAPFGGAVGTMESQVTIRGADVFGCEDAIEAVPLDFFANEAALDLGPAGVVEPTIDVGTWVDASSFYGNTGLADVFSYEQPMHVSNSVFTDSECTFVVGADRIGPMLPDRQHLLTVEGSTFQGNGAELPIWSGADYGADALVANTIAWDNASEFDTWGCFVLNSDLTVDTDDPFTEAPVGVFEEDPLFMDSAAGDLRLMPGSPCIDVGAEGIPVDWADYLDDWSPVAWDRDVLSRPTDGDADGDEEFDAGAYEYMPSGRVAGANRYATAAQTSAQYFGTADTVVIATGRTFADGLAAAGLAGLYNAPLLLTEPTMLSGGVAGEIARLGASRVFICGGEAAVNGIVATQLGALPGVDEIVRIGGSNRYETAALIAEHILSRQDPENVPFTLIARGDLFPDALAAAPIAYANKAPILLVTPDELPPTTVDVLYDFGITRAAIVGGTSAVGAGVEYGVQKMLDPERVSGRDRYETAAKLASWAAENDYADFGMVGVATGLDFADALSGGAGIGAAHGVLLLTPATSLSPFTSLAIENHAEEVLSIRTFGGVNAVSDGVYKQIMDIL